MKKTMSGKIKIATNMKKLYLILAVACLAAIGCTKEISDNSIPTGSVVLNAKVESDTKVGATVDKENSTVAFTWTKGDQIAVQTTSGVANFTLVGEGGEPNAQFSGNETPVNGGFAIFPAAAADVEAGKVNLPSEYNYVEGQTNALLYATVINDVVRFTHLGGLLSVEINGVPAGAKFVLTAEGLKINGEYAINTSAEVPVLNVVEAASAAESTVAVNFENATENAVVYIPLPAGDYTSMKAQIFTSENKLISEAVASTTKSIKRKGLKAMPNMVLMLNDWFVTSAGAGSKDGSSWDNAMGTAELRTLLTEADAAQLDGATINMAAGEYYIAGEAGKTVSIAFADAEKQVSIAIRGGYPANLTGLSKKGRDASANATVFTGNNEAGIFVIGNKTDMTFDGLTLQNCNFESMNKDGGAIETVADEAGECTITLTNCQILNNKNTSGKTGAGLYVINTTVNIDNCNFSGNYARNGSAINMKAGKGSVTIENTTFTSNSTGNTSGAIQNGGMTAELKNCTFKKNQAGSWGGGAFHTGGSANTTFTNCAFEENTAPYGGAISVEAATVTFNTCTFSKNTATQPVTTKDGATVIPNVGGAIILRNNAAVCTLNDCTLNENQAVTGSGGAIVVDKAGAKLTINGGSFTANTSMYHGGCIMSFGELYINGTSSAKVNFVNNNTLTTAKAGGNGGAIWIGDNTKNDFKYVYFSGNEAGKEQAGSVVDYSNGGSIYVKSADLFNVDNCEFTGGRARNGGAIAIYLGTATEPKSGKITNCNFHDIKMRSGAKYDGSVKDKDGKNGNFNGGACQIAYGNIEFENCIFKGNIVNNSSAALHINDVCTVSCTDCQFLNNKAYSNHGCIKMEKAGEKLYLNRCVFDANEGDTRGMINPGANTMVYMNRVVFHENKTIKAGDQYGVCVHAGAANICMNNVTSYNNYNKNLETNRKMPAFNSDGGWIIVNSTIIDKTPQLLRANGAFKVSLCNNIMINTLVPGTIFMLNTNTVFNDKGHNVMSCAGNHDKAVLASTDLLGQSAETLAGTYGNGVYSWTNSLTGFTPATSADVYAAISEFTASNATAGIDNIGADFYNWLKAIGEVTESGDQKIFKDGRGVTRTGNYQPGAYQAN